MSESEFSAGAAARTAQLVEALRGLLERVCAYPPGSEFHDAQCVHKKEWAALEAATEE